MLPLTIAVEPNALAKLVAGIGAFVVHAFATGSYSSHASTKAPLKPPMA
jgi:hypothetical protein